MRYRDVAGAAVLASCIALAAPAARAQRIGTGDLLALGTAAYDRLPATLTLRDAPGFSEALGYLYAYEQRALREGDHRVNAGAETALGWLLSSMASMKTGKGDAIRNDGELLDRGLLMLGKAKSSEQNGKIWDVPAYLSSSANLFAYLQVAPRPDDRARDGHRWLVDAQSRLVRAGVGAADGARDPEGWFPRGRRPGAPLPALTSRPDVPRPGVGSRADTPAAGPASGERGSRDSAGAAPPVPTDSVQPVREPSNEAALDTTAKLLMQGRLREARDVARGMLDANPGDGDAHLALAMIYAKASGARASPEDRAVLWLSSHHLNIAIKMRAIGYDVGRTMLQELEANIPTADDLKARGWIAGQRIRVSFTPYEWIDEETTIRPRNE